MEVGADKWVYGDDMPDDSRSRNHSHRIVDSNEPKLRYKSQQLLVLRPSLWRSKLQICFKLIIRLPSTPMTLSLVNTEILKMLYSNMFLQKFIVQTVREIEVNLELIIGTYEELSRPIALTRIAILYHQPLP